MKHLTNPKRILVGSIILLVSSLMVYSAVDDWAMQVMFIILGFLYVSTGMFVIIRRVQTESRTAGRFVIDRPTRILLLVFCIGVFPLAIMFIQLNR